MIKLPMMTQSIIFLYILNYYIYTLFISFMDR